MRLGPNSSRWALARYLLSDRGDGMRSRVYETRVLAETMISRPVMKGFKARLRRDGVLPAQTG